MQENRHGPARRVAFVFTSMPVGGAEDFALGAGSHLAPEFEARYVCLREYGPLGDEALAAGRAVSLVPVFPSRWITPWAVRRFAAWLRREDISIVHSQTHHAHVFATKAGSLAGIPSVVHQQKTIEDLPPRRARIFQACLQRCSHVVALSRRTAADLMRLSGLPQEKFTVIPNGIDRASFRPCDDRAALRRELGLPTDTFLVGTIGRLHQHKSHETTVEAVATARKQGVNVMAVLVGEGAQREVLERRARDLGIGNAVLFPGAQRPVAPWVQALDLFVLPSIWEGQPLALLQAVACGVPALASNIEGNTAVLGLDHPGLFPPGDSGWLAKLIAQAARDESYILKLRESQQRVAIPWSDEAARQLAALYRSLLK